MRIMNNEIITLKDLKTALLLYFQNRLSNPDDFITDEELEESTAEELAESTLETILSYLNN